MLNINTFWASLESVRVLFSFWDVRNIDWDPNLGENVGHNRYIYENYT